MAKKVFLAPGHGGSDPGAIGVNGAKEKNYTLAITKYCAAALKRCGVDYMMSRTTDVDPVDTVAKCNKYNPDVAVSIHLNAYNKNVRGTEVFCSIVGGAGEKLATCIYNHIVKLGVPKRGVKTKKNNRGKDYFEFIRETNAPANLVECCFIDNKEDYAFISTAAKQKIMGEAIAKGICGYLGVKFVEEAPKVEATTNTDKLYRVQVGAFSNKKNAEALQSKLKKAGFDSVIV